MTTVGDMLDSSEGTERPSWSKGNVKGGNKGGNEKGGNDKGGGKGGCWGKGGGDDGGKGQTGGLASVPSLPLPLAWRTAADAALPAERAVCLTPPGHEHEECEDNGSACWKKASKKSSSNYPCAECGMLGICAAKGHLCKACFIKKALYLRWLGA